MSNEKNYSGGAGFTGLLLIAFIVLKLCGVINWSWWWVLSPFWIPCALFLLILIPYLILKRKDKKQIKAMNRGTIKSKWQERMEEMQKLQKEKNN